MKDTMKACFKNIKTFIANMQNIIVYLYSLLDFALVVINATYPIVSFKNNKIHNSIQLVIKKLKIIKFHNKHPKINTYWPSNYRIYIKSS